jgi:hypothetical protein
MDPYMQEGYILKNNKYPPHREQKEQYRGRTYPQVGHDSSQRYSSGDDIATA